MTLTTAAAFDLPDTYVHLDGAAAATIDGGDGFWERLAAGGDPAVERMATGGWMVMTFHNARTWPTWEVHPEGDELVHLIGGHLDLLLELPGGVATVPMTAGRTIVVPQGVWHTAVVHEPGDTLHVTFGKGTENRPA